MVLLRVNKAPDFVHLDALRFEIADVLIGADAFASSTPIRATGAHRTVLMSEEINRLLTGPWEDEEMGARCTKLLAMQQRIVSGEMLVVCMTPFKARSAHIGRLDRADDAVFYIRSRDEPGLRVFSRVAEKDVLVALICAPRSVIVDWLERGPLGDRFSREWRRGVADCKEQWSKLFPAHDPVKGDNLNDYFSDAITE